MGYRIDRRVVAKTADYTINAVVDKSGQVFTNEGAAGAVIFTLPQPNLALRGCFYEFLSIADQDVTVKTATADTLRTKNDAAADSLAASTTNEKIGALMRAICDGSKWNVSGLAVGHTYTVAT